MTVFGITGGIATGKSQSASILASLGGHVIDTDQVAHDLTAPGQPALAEILSEFGPAVLDAEGRLERSRLAEIVFNDSNARTRLEQILHPKIAEAWARQITEWRAQGYPWGAVVVPLLYEKGYDGQFMPVVCLACLHDTQLCRARKRGWTEDQFRKRESAQIPLEIKIARANHMVWTEGSLDAHRMQWNRILAHSGVGQQLR